VSFAVKDRWAFLHWSTGRQGDDGRGKGLFFNIIGGNYFIISYSLLVILRFRIPMTVEDVWFMISRFYDSCLPAGRCDLRLKNLEPYHDYFLQSQYVRNRMLKLRVSFVSFTAKDRWPWPMTLPSLKYRKTRRWRKREGLVFTMIVENILYHSLFIIGYFAV